MSEWSWEYMSGAEYTLGSLSPNLVAEAERIAQRLTDAASVKYIGEPAIEESGVSNLLSFGEGPWLVTYQEAWRRRTVYIVGVEYVG